MIAVGAILTWAVHPAHEGSVDPQTTGVILLVAGLLAFLLDLLLWSEWGPGYLGRRAAVVEDAPSYRRRVAYPLRRRTMIEEDVAPPTPPGV